MTTTAIVPSPSLPAGETPRTGPQLWPIGAAAVTALAVFMLGAVAWASLVPLSGAVLAYGQIVVQSYKKAVQSRDGGSIKKLHVAEGSRVSAGDLLVEFEDTQAAANYRVFEQQLLAALARKARLEASIAAVSSIVWSDFILERSAQPEVRRIIDVESALLVASRTEYLGRRQVLERSVAELQQQVQSLAAQAKSVEDQLPLIEEEAEDVATLLAKGLERKPRLLALQRAKAELLGRREQIAATIRQVRESLAAAELELIALRNSRQAEFARELTETSNRIAELQQGVRSAADRLAQTAVYAPVAGTVVGLAFHTVGGVVQPGETILSIVPRQDELVVDARVNPGDIDALHEDQPAEVRLLAHKWRDRPPLRAILARISADLIRDVRTNEEYYEVRLRIDLDGATEDGVPREDIHVGMKADVAVLTENRTAFEYLTGPITRYMFRAFREQ